VALLKKPNAEVNIDIGSKPYYPGDKVNVKVNISSSDNFTARSGSVELSCREVYWHVVSSGKSSSQQKTQRCEFKLKEEIFGNTEFTSGTVINGSASFMLPDDSLPSVQGEIVDISYYLEFKLDVPRRRDVREMQGMTVLSIPKGIPIVEEGYKKSSNKRMESSDDCDLSLSLDSTHGTTGQIFKGKFEVMVKKDINIRGIRVELELREKAGTKYSKTVADVMVLEEQMSLVSGAVRQWSFQLRLPDSPPASYEAKESWAEWIVKGILDRRGKKDISVIYPVHVFST